MDRRDFLQRAVLAGAAGTLPAAEAAARTAPPAPLESFELEEATIATLSEGMTSEK